MWYFRRPWNECRGDDYGGWGTSIWYFEVGDDCWGIRQVEEYANGYVLTYDDVHDDDEFGGLSHAPFDLQEFQPFAISAEEFENILKNVKPFNR